jgi:hypothetical protein
MTSMPSAHARSPTTCAGTPRYRQTLRFEVRELGEIDMVSRALATLDLVTHDDALWAFPAVRLEDRALSSGELAGLGGESERVLCHESSALVLWAEDRSAVGKVQRWWLADYHENGTTPP